MMYDDSSVFYVMDRDNDVIQVITGYTTLTQLVPSYIRADIVGDSFNKLRAYYNDYKNRTECTKVKIDYIICDAAFRVVPVYQILRDETAPRRSRSSGRHTTYSTNWKFRSDPVPGTGKSYSKHNKYWRHPKTTQERKVNCEHKQYTRGKRRNLPNTWDDIGRSDRQIKHSWKARKVRKQWMKNMPAHKATTQQQYSIDSEGRRIIHTATPRKTPKLNNWLYIYIVSEDNTCILYERSMPRECIRQADDRVNVLRERGHEAFYTIGTTFPGALS